MKAGRPEEAQRSIGEMQQPGLGMFQYVADLALLFSPTPFQPRWVGGCIDRSGVECISLYCSVVECRVELREE